MPDLSPTEGGLVHIEFEWRPVPDPQETENTGRQAYRDAAFAIITPPGSGRFTRVEKQVDENLLKLWQFGDHKIGCPPRPHLHRAYEAWRQGHDTPLEGIPIKNWPQITPAQVKMCHKANVLTVEQLAEATDVVLREIGMGAVPLKQQARQYLKAAQLTIDAEKQERLEALLAKSQAQIEELEARIEAKALEDKTQKGAGDDPHQKTKLKK